jgi:hypothetical protein
VAASAAIAASAPAVAQAPPGPDRPTQVDPRGCAADEWLQPDPQKPGATKPPQGTTGESLSEKLARTDGVLCPPNVDPDIRAPAPGGGKTPVIPPPGSPGGDPSVRPK